MSKFIKFVLFLPLKIAALFGVVAIVGITWVAIFFIGMSAWIFDLVSFLLFTCGVIGGFSGELQGAMLWECLGISFVIFLVPYVAEWFIFRITDLRLILWDFTFEKR